MQCHPLVEMTAQVDGQKAVWMTDLSTVVGGGAVPSWTELTVGLNWQGRLDQKSLPTPYHAGILNSMTGTVLLDTFSHDWEQ